MDFGGVSINQNILNAIELYTFNGWVVCFMNYLSINKAVKKREEKEVKYWYTLQLGWPLKTCADQTKAVPQGSQRWGFQSGVYCSPSQMQSANQRSFLLRTDLPTEIYNIPAFIGLPRE